MGQSPQWGHMNRMGSGLPLKSTPAWCLGSLPWHNLPLLPGEGMATGAIPIGAAAEGRSHCFPPTSTASLWFLRGVWGDDGSTAASKTGAWALGAQPCWHSGGRGGVCWQGSTASALPQLSGQGQCVLSNQASLGRGLIAHHTSPLGKPRLNSILSSLACTPKK